MLGQAGVPAKGLHSQGPPCSSTVQLQGVSLVSFGLGPAQGSGHEMARSIWGPLGGGIFVNLPWGYISTWGVGVNHPLNIQVYDSYAKRW